MSLTSGALFAGYGGLDLAVEEVFGARPAWVSEFDPAPSRILAQRFPDVPNLGDVTKVQWGPECPTSPGHKVQVFRFGYAADTTAETVYRCVDCGWELPVDQRPEGIPYPVEIITGGSPCQDLSHAGKRAGMRSGRVIPAGVMACGCRWAEHEVDSCSAASPAGDVPSRLHAHQEHVAAMRAVAALNARDRADGVPPPERREAGTRSGLWASMCDAIEIIRPRFVVWENVRGALSAEADSAVEPCPICVGDGRGVTLRALGRVLGDLAELGYDAAWTVVRASDVGAPHRRERVFVLAWPADAEGPGLEAWREGRRGGGAAAAGLGGRPADLTLLPSPRTSDTNGPGMHGDGGLDLRTAVTLLPTPTMTNAHGNTENNRGDRLLPGVVLDLLPTPRATDGTKGGPNQRGSSGDLMLPSAVTHLLPTPTTEPTTGNGHARNLGEEARLLPTPSVADMEGGRKHRSGARSGELLLNGLAHAQAFGQYAPAIARWDAVLGRPAPAPTEPTGKGGAHRLSPRFVEWLMGLPDGWVTGESVEAWRARLVARRAGLDPRPVGHRGSVARRPPFITRNEQLKALGNGVVPQQAAAALRWLLAVREAALAGQEVAA
jgi:DNA (cytosine-5)-methyltransferase 1